MADPEVLAITLNANEKISCSCLCANCGGGRSAYSSRRWDTTQAGTHCKNQQRGCGFSTGQETSFQVY